MARTPAASGQGIRRYRKTRRISRVCPAHPTTGRVLCLALSVSLVAQKVLRLVCAILCGPRLCPDPGAWMTENPMGTAPPGRKMPEYRALRERRVGASSAATYDAFAGCLPAPGSATIGALVAAGEDPVRVVAARGTYFRTQDLTP